MPLRGISDVQHRHWTTYEMQFLCTAEYIVYLNGMTNIGTLSVAIEKYSYSYCY